MKFETVILVLLAVCFQGCKKSDPQPANGNARLLSGDPGKSKSWKLVVASQQLEDGAITPYTIGACTLDNIYTFTNNAEQTYEATEGPTKCLDSDPDLVESGNWAFTNDGKIVMILSNHVLPSNPGSLFSFYGFALPSEIITLTDNTFKVKMTYILQQGVATINHYYYFSFTKI